MTRGVKVEGCTVADCDGEHYGRGMCGFHYQRRWRRRTPVDAPRRRSPAPSKQGVWGAWYEVPGTGYVERRRRMPDGSLQRELQHRVVMAEMIGRPLTADENVHHRNGQRADNRRENLELWTTMQPSGKRVEDLMAFAREVLARYGA